MDTHIKRLEGRDRDTLLMRCIIIETWKGWFGIYIDLIVRMKH